jgi:hypothetical protein
VDRVVLKQMDDWRLPGCGRRLWSIDRLITHGTRSEAGRQ